ncbi:MAG TPA: prepilin-type N-terminal cleavage/methylation domain-containing protein [Candidatus Paceibacterota bacterium]|nr:prepilin-type N-terminal cleavage/methylation domain-containing protein [Candidatus Paceibacterota bacterium]
MNTRRGFSLLELLIVIAIIGILTSIALVATTQARTKARDSERMMEISQFGRILTGNCYLPNAGPGDYDISEIVPELIAQNAQYAEYLSTIPLDPNGTASNTLYRYLVTAGGHCALYANLEYSDEPVILTNLTVPTVNAGTGVFEASTVGPNGTTKYFQVSN